MAQAAQLLHRLLTQSCSSRAWMEKNSHRLSAPAGPTAKSYKQAACVRTRGWEFSSAVALGSRSQSNVRRRTQGQEPARTESAETGAIVQCLMAISFTAQSEAGKEWWKLRPALGLLGLLVFWCFCWGQRLSRGRV